MGAQQSTSKASAAAHSSPAGQHQRRLGVIFLAGSLMAPLGALQSALGKLEQHTSRRASYAPRRGTFAAARRPILGNLTLFYFGSRVAT